MIIENNFGEKDNDFYGVRKICICSCIWSDVQQATNFGFNRRGF
jgi:hypothetical protein